MVDLHQKEPGLPEGHPWLETSRWGMAWRVTIACALVGMLGTLLLAGFGLGNPNQQGFTGPIAFFFGLLPALFFGLLAAMIGPWLRRFYPFSQGILFGLIGVACCALVMLGIDIAESIVRPCPPDTLCFGPGEGMLLVLVFAGAPLGLMAGTGLGTAILVSGSRRARRIFSRLLLVVTLVFAVANLLPLLR